ncbi:MAG TPA: 1-deoxy-D-xylulose-5-phosphate synthase N-terminal domain-containing protein [Gemmatirosa sp.]
MPPSAHPAVTPSLRSMARRRLLRMHYEAKTGHIGGNLSALDILLTLYHGALQPGDSFVLSKGHSAGAFYVTLWTCGRLTDDDLATFHRDDTRLSGHPPTTGIPDVLFATGSLGHGLGLANGLALGKQIKGERGRVVCLTSDGEWNEGSCWESLIFARHHQVPLTLVVDVNGLQGFGTTREVADLDPIDEKFRAFGVPTVVVDGHDTTALADAFAQAADGGPFAIVARTQKGHGVSFMENRMDWHYRPLTAEEYADALADLDGATSDEADA